MTVLAPIGRSLYEALAMFWNTLWALVLGFGLSGAVQAFVSRGRMRRALGDHAPRTVAKAGVLGAISSSCSYAAAALAKSLFARGADLTASLVFMVASTNLVIELGVVLWLLLGWPFALAELVGGVIMIVLLTLVVPRAIPRSWVDQARERLDEGGSDDDTGTGAGRTPLRERLRSRAGWSDAAGYTISDVTMLRAELAVGFVVAGFAATLVPTWVWRSLFLTGYGFWSSLENVVLGPFLAVISFVCSVGNVPLAAALWTGGISFGGVVAFVFGDLITLPLLLIYRKYYGTRFALRLFGIFWAVMAVTGLAVEYLFGALGLVPTTRPEVPAMAGFSWNYTAWLNIVAVVVFAVLYRLYRTRDRHGGGEGLAKDVVCGMQVETASAPATARHDGATWYFCSDGCRDRFAADPERYAVASVDAPGRPGDGSEHDPVCGMAVDPATAVSTEHDGRTVSFCSDRCRDAFLADPDRHLDPRDPVCAMTVDRDGATSVEHDGRTFHFCGEGCRDAFAADPAAYRPSPAPSPR